MLLIASWKLRPVSTTSLERLLSLLLAKYNFSTKSPLRAGTRFVSTCCSSLPRWARRGQARAYPESLTRTQVDGVPSWKDVVTKRDNDKERQ